MAHTKHRFVLIIVEQWKNALRGKGQYTVQRWSVWTDSPLKSLSNRSFLLTDDLPLPVSALPARLNGPGLCVLASAPRQHAFITNFTSPQLTSPHCFACRMSTTDIYPTLHQPACRLRLPVCTATRKTKSSVLVCPCSCISSRTPRCATPFVS